MINSDGNKMEFTWENDGYQAKLKADQKQHRTDRQEHCKIFGHFQILNINTVYHPTGLHSNGRPVEL